MYTSKWVEQDGYVESIVSIRHDLGPILKVRAVRNEAGKFEPVVRDYQTGIVVAASNLADDLNSTMKRGVNLAKGILAEASA